jgi:hypothetical protein
MNTAPLVEAEQDRAVRIENLPKVVMGGRASRLSEQRLVPSEAARDIAYPMIVHVPFVHPSAADSCRDRA